MKSRNVLLLEPKYKNKFPPIGLMKIATYHRMLGDNVTFFKGNLQDFILDQIYLECLEKLEYLESSVNWASQQDFIKDFIRKNELTLFDDVNLLESDNKPLIKEWLNYYRDYYKKDKYKQEPRWDRVCVTTLFTFHWKITIETIEFAQKIVKTPEELKVGGIMASLLPEEIKEATCVEPIQGLLDKPFMLDSDSDIIIDNLSLDYSILDEIEYQYPIRDAYFTSMTKGCKNKCAFCAVPKIEPDYKEKIPTIKRINRIKKLYGEQQNLLLMDNHILASPKFPEIIRDIKKMGFYKGATYIEPNQLEIAIRNLENGLNDKAYIRRAYRLIHQLLKRVKGNTAQTYYNFLDEYNLLKLETTTKEKLLAVYPKIAEIYERLRTKTPRSRHVDFNQGIDCREITDEVMKLISEIPIQPLRIAFDDIKLKEEYEKAVELAANYGIKELSNYILYNYNDSPDELYERLKINQELCERLNVRIYSFPMKYLPVNGKWAKNREYIGPKWKRKFIRAIQSVLNVTKGIVPPARTNEKGNFFEKAFGRDLEEFHELLYMPEAYIVYRKIFEEDLGYTLKWQETFRSLNKEEFEEVKPIIENNESRDYYQKTENPKFLELLKHYTLPRHVTKEDKGYEKLKRKYDGLINNEVPKDINLTFDFENTIPQKA